MERWAGKIAVVTGASSGIGLATAKALLQHGLIVVGIARRKTKMENEMKNAKGGDFHAIECDLTNEQQVHDAFQWIKKNLKTVHILINNAGCIKYGKIENVGFDELKKVIDMNLNGTLLCSKLAINIMKESGNKESHIIMINSELGQRIPPPIPNSDYGSNIYAATKYAIRGLVLTLKNELCGQNIRVSNLSPGAVKTEMLDSMMEKIPEIAGISTMKAEDVADAVTYILATPLRVQVEELFITPFQVTC